MELYEFSADRRNLLVYELTAIKEEIKKYKEEHLEPRFYDLETVNGNVVDRLFDGEKMQEFSLNVQTESIYTKLIMDSKEYNNEVRDNLLKRYYNSECLDFDVARVYNRLNEFSYALLPLDNYKGMYTNDFTYLYKCSNLLVLPKDLVGLHFLEQGNYKELALDDVISRETPFYLFDLEFKNNYNCSMSVLDLPIMKDAKEKIAYSSKMLTLYHRSKNKHKRQSK